MFTDKDLQNIFDMAVELERDFRNSAIDNKRHEVWTPESTLLDEKHTTVTGVNGEKIDFTILTCDTMTYLRFVNAYEDIVKEYGAETIEGFSKTASLMLETFVGEISNGKKFLEENSVSTISELVKEVVDNIVL